MHNKSKIEDVTTWIEVDAQTWYAYAYAKKCFELDLGYKPWCQSNENRQLVGGTLKMVRPYYDVCSLHYQHLRLPLLLITKLAPEIYL